MPKLTGIANAPPQVLGVANIRGQIIPVIDLPAMVGWTPKRGHSILMVTEYERTTQAFAVEEVDEIVRLEWSDVLAAEGNGGDLVTSIAKLAGENGSTRLVQVLDVEQILRSVKPASANETALDAVGDQVVLPPGSIVLAADDSPVARMLIEQGLGAMGVSFVMTKTRAGGLGPAAVDRRRGARRRPGRHRPGGPGADRPGDAGHGRLHAHAQHQAGPALQVHPGGHHSSLTGTTNEAHVKAVGADAYVAKFVASELASALRQVLVH